MTSSKYALVERERRFLVAELPETEPSARRSITDLYVDRTRLRLRLVEEVVDGRVEVARKLTQKVPQRNGVVGHRGFITTMYLDEDEYRVFGELPGCWLSKQRLTIEQMGVDVFASPLEGLMIGEAEFVDEATMKAFVPPPWCGSEVTDHPGFDGANLARLAQLLEVDAVQALARLVSTASRP